ncbi:MAG: AMP-binding protein [Acidobacteriota bacterium]
MSNSRITVAEFISRYPGFTFDLEEFIASTKYEEELRERFRLFKNTGDSNNYGARLANNILETFRKDLCHLVRAYRNYAGIESLAELPLICKDLIRQDPDAFVSSSLQQEVVWKKETSGTTGPPVAVWYAPEFYFDLLLLSIRKIASLAGANDVGQRPIFCVAVTDNTSCKDFVVADPADEVGFLLQVVIDERKPETIERLFRLLQALQPACMTAKPSIYEVILSYAARTNLRKPCSPDVLISSGAALEESLRNQVEGLFQAMLINGYGMTEFGLIASECHQQEGFHIDESSILIEVMRAAGAPEKEAAEGELVLSSVSNMGMPLLRYETGDLAQLETEPCACGFQGRRIRKLSGRRVRCFRFASGELFSPTHFNDLFSRFPLREFQITQTSLQSFDLLVEFSKGCDDSKGTLRAISEHIRNTLSSPVKVCALATTFPRDSKFERYRTLV